MKSRLFSILLGFITLFTALSAHAQEPPATLQPRQKFTLVGIGQARMLDTYLSNENYTGTELRMITHSEKSHFREAALKSEVGIESFSDDTLRTLGLLLRKDG